MEDSKKKKIIWIIRILVAVMFLFSAYAKFCPWPCKGVFIFESKYLASIGIEGYWAQIFSKVLIGVELAIGILLLLPYYIKKYIMPLTITILGLFSIHLIVQIIDGASGNCGCFGECYTMTPVQALIKNILAIVILLIPLKWKELVEEKENLNPIIITFLASILLIFLLMQRCCGAGNGGEVYKAKIESSDNEYSKYFDDINKGNKLLLFLDPTCDHCKEMLSELIQLKKTYPGIIPEIKIIFGNDYGDDTKSLIEKLFQNVGHSFDYTILSSQEWNDEFFRDYYTPGLKYLYNGKERLFFHGEGEAAFDANKLLIEIRREY